MKKKAFRAALPYSLPICIGFLFIAMSYGFLMRSRGFSVFYPMAMSAFIFAGSMEFVAVELLLSAYAPLHAFLLTLMVYTAELAGAVAERRFGALGGKIVFWAVYLGLTAAVLLETLVGVEFLSPGLTRLYLPFYLAGYLAGEQKERLKALPEMVKNAGGALSLVGLLTMAVLLDLQDVTTLLLLGRQIVASFLGCAAVCWLLWKCGPNRFKKFLAWLGGYTLEIYVVHFHFATVLNRGQVYAQYSAGWFLFVLASFIAMSVITAAIIAVTKRVRLLDFLLYGKWPADGRFFGKVQE